MTNKKYSRELKITSKNKHFFEHPLINQTDIDMVVDALKKGDISWPDGVTSKLEQYYCKKFGSKYAVAHCNATSAMFSAFSAIGLTKQSEIICPTYTWWASISPAIFFGSKIVFCDSSKQTLTPSLEDIQKVITNKTKGIVLPHLWGEIGDLKAISKFCKEKDLFLIEDNSHGIGGKLGNKSVGTFGDICVTSLQKNKGICGGEGGILSTNSKESYEKSLLIGHYERLKYVSNKNINKFKSTGGGLKFRIHPLSSALALSKLKQLDKQIKIENKLMDIFRQKLNKIYAVKTFETNNASFTHGVGHGFRFRLQLEDFNLPKQEIIERLVKKGFPIADESYPLLHKQELFKTYSQNQKYPTIESIHPYLIAHPIFRRGTKKDVIDYTREFKDALESLGKILKD